MMTCVCVLDCLFMSLFPYLVILVLVSKLISVTFNRSHIPDFARKYIYPFKRSE